MPPSPGSTRAVRNCSVVSVDAGRLVVGARGRRAGRPGRRRGCVRSARSGTRSARSSTSRTPCSSSYRATRRIAPAASSASRSRMKIESGWLGATWTTTMSWSSLRVGRQHAVVGAREEVAQHADDRRDAGAGGDHEELAALGRQHELAGRLLEVDQRAGRGAVDEVVADQAVGHGLDGDRDAAVAARAVGERVGAPLAYAVDVDADAEVLAGHVAGPVGAGADHDGGGVGGLGVDRLDAAAQVGAGAQRGEEVEEVGREVAAWWRPRRRGPGGRPVGGSVGCCPWAARESWS